MGIERDTPAAKALFAVDELTGFLTACALVRPDKSIADVRVKSVKKKMKSKAFAASVNRDDIREGVEAAASQVGGKMASLGEVRRRLSVKIPNGFVVTADDVAVWLPERRVLAVGDLAGPAPAIGRDTDTASWIAVLERLERLVDAPPHGLDEAPDAAQLALDLGLGTAAQARGLLLQGGRVAPQLVEAATKAGNRADDYFEFAGRELRRSQLLRRHRLADRGERGVRSRAEDRQPPRDAQLQGAA